MARRQSLREYQDAVLERMELARQNVSGQRTQYFGFHCAGRNFLARGEHLSEVTSVTPLQPVPQSKPWVSGAANIKGAVHLVVDLAVLLGGVRTRGGKLLAIDSSLISGSALLVERLAGIYESAELVALKRGSKSPADPDWLGESYEVSGQFFQMMSLPGIVADPRFAKLQSGDAR